MNSGKGIGAATMASALSNKIVTFLPCFAKNDAALSSSGDASVAVNYSSPRMSVRLAIWDSLLRRFSAAYDEDVAGIGAGAGERLCYVEYGGLMGCDLARVYHRACEPYR